MSTAEMKNILKSKIETLSNEDVEKVFPKIIDAIENVKKEKIDLTKHADGIFKKYDELMKKLA